MTVESKYVLRLLRLVIGLKDSRQFFNQWEAQSKSIAPCTCDLSRASSELHIIARNCDWFIALPAPVVIGRSNCFGFGFSIVIWKPLYFVRRFMVCVFIDHWNLSLWCGPKHVPYGTWPEYSLWNECFCMRICQVCKEPRHARMYHMEEITRTLFYIYWNCY